MKSRGLESLHAKKYLGKEIARYHRVASRLKDFYRYEGIYCPNSFEQKHQSFYTILVCPKILGQDRYMYLFLHFLMVSQFFGCPKTSIYEALVMGLLFPWQLLLNFLLQTEC